MAANKVVKEENILYNRVCLTTTMLNLLNVRKYLFGRYFYLQCTLEDKQFLYQFENFLNIVNRNIFIFI